MRRFKFRKLDAFTDGASAGNPAGLVLLAPNEVVTDAEMQRLATQVAATGYVTEVAFARPVGPAELELRYFSCEREVPFCGHATVASMYHLLADVPEYRGLPWLTLHTRKGRLEVENRIVAEDCVFIAAPAPAFPDIRVTADEAAAALGFEEGRGVLADESAVASAKKEPPLKEDGSPYLGRSSEGMALAGAVTDGVLPVCECGQKCLLVPVVGLDAILACAPSYPTLRALADRTGIEVVVLFTRETQLPDRTLRTRVFAPAFGYLEDPATGSGSAALAHWLRRTGVWTSDVLTIEQGPDRANPNRVSIRADAAGGLHIGGRAVARIEGEYLLH